jgi:predicted TPR repeat methyltransferase
VLVEGLRYAHGVSHVRASLEAAGLVLDQLEAASSRTEGGVPVPGLVAVATKA